VDVGQHQERDPAEQAALAEIRRLRSRGTTLGFYSDPELRHQVLCTAWLRRYPMRMKAVRHFILTAPKPCRLWHALGATLLLLGTVAAVEHASAQSQMPAGPGETVFENACLQCHGAEMVIGTKMSKGGWQSTVDDMIAKGAQASDDDVKILVDYLAKNFAEDAAPKVNVNHETAKGLQTQLELSEKEAQAIVDYRGNNGDFKTVDDLKKVPGLDAAKIDAKKDRLAF